MTAGRGGWANWLGAALVAAATLGPAGWMLSDHLERDDDFCNACHLTPTQPLHERIRSDFDARPAANLAAAHARAGNERRPDGAFRCIDCHGGTGVVGRVRVKALAAKDAFWYVVGNFDEPTQMRWPLWDQDCAKCHAVFEPETGDAGGAQSFHAVPLHNADLGVACVECHAAHESGGNPGTWFLQASRLRPLCARCHSEFLHSEEGS